MIRPIAIPAATLASLALVTLSSLAFAAETSPVAPTIPATIQDPAALPPPPDMPSGVADISVEEVERLTGEKKAIVFDVNSKGTREKMGSVPNATLLGSTSDYPSTALPKDKSTTLVFYCANPRCTASHTAAKRAVSLGYSDVRVMSAGIAGWKDSGRNSVQPQG